MAPPIVAHASVARAAAAGPLRGAVLPFGALRVIGAADPLRAAVVARPVGWSRVGAGEGRCGRGEHDEGERTSNLARTKGEHDLLAAYRRLNTRQQGALLEVARSMQPRAMKK